MESANGDEMKREIKFREAVVVNEKFCRFRYWGFLEDGYSSPLDDGTIQFESQQFTGLKDKNGVEIYEGDLLYYESADENPATVVWRDAGFCSARFIEEGVTAYRTVIGSEVPEIVGNIYENPELLEAK